MLRERRINGPVILVVLAVVGWITVWGVLAVHAGRKVFAHQHTAECWDH